MLGQMYNKRVQVSVIAVNLYPVICLTSGQKPTVSLWSWGWIGNAVTEHYLAMWRVCHGFCWAAHWDAPQFILPGA